MQFGSGRIIRRESWLSVAPQQPLIDPRLDIHALQRRRHPPLQPLPVCNFKVLLDGGVAYSIAPRKLATTCPSAAFTDDLRTSTHNRSYRNCLSTTTGSPAILWLTFSY